VEKKVDLLLKSILIQQAEGQLSAQEVFRFERLEAGKRSGHGMDRSPHRHTFNELFVFESGSGYHDIDFERFQIRTGSVHWVRAEQLHFLERDANCSGWVMGFSSDLFSDIGEGSWFSGLLLNQVDEDNCPVFELETWMYLELLQLIKAIEWGIKHAHGKSLQLGRLRLILLLIEENARKKNNKPMQNAGRLKIYKAFIRLVELTFREELKLPDYANRLHCSLAQLRSSCLAATAKGPQELIQQRKLLEAKRLLFHSSSSVKEIAYALGFEDPAYFGRFFKRLTNTSPDSFRRLIREKYH
jgi:AraC family transcriptional regulator, transcriptional activator of pobA